MKVKFWILLWIPKTIVTLPLVIISFVACTPISSPEMPPPFVPTVTQPIELLPSTPTPHATKAYHSYPVPATAMPVYPTTLVTGMYTSYPPPFTPNPLTPIETIVPYISSTPQPPTLTPTKIIRPTIIPPILPVSDGNLPQLTHDLIYSSGAGLMLWSHETGNVETLIEAHDIAVGYIREIVVSADGQQAALLHNKADKVDGLSILDLKTRQITPLVEIETEGYVLFDVNFSPDGKWISYLLEDVLERQGTINVSRVDRASIAEVGYCVEGSSVELNGECYTYLWSPDSRSILWSDARGIWLADIGQPARLIIAQGKDVGEQIYIPSAWSPSGQFILSNNAFVDSDVGCYGILDARSGDIDESFHACVSIGAPGIDVIWLQDDRLFVTRPAYWEDDRLPTLEIWSVSPGVDKLLTPEKTFSINIDPQKNWPANPIQLRDGRIVFFVLNNDNADYQSRGLYLTTSNLDAPVKVNGVPPLMPDNFYAEILWAPDGSGAIYHDWDTEMLLYIPTSENTLLDLRPFLGDHAPNFIWSPAN